jgi:hypothetical protein
VNEILPAIDPTNSDYFERSFHNTTTLDPIGLSVFLVFVVWFLLAKRSSALFPILFSVSVLSHEERVVIAGLDFSFLRLLVVCGAIRGVMQNEWRGIRLNPFDYLFGVSLIYSSCIGVLRDPSSVVNALGGIFDGIGIYFLGRMLIRNFRDLDEFGKAASIVAMVIAPFFLIEWTTGRNFFSVLGGVPEWSLIHEGRMRAKGAFAHMIVAGAFWATLIPFIAVRWWNPRASKPFVVAGLLSALAVVGASSSSTPVLGVVASFGAAFLFPIRLQLRWIRRAVVVTLVSLHMVMQKPVWHLIARIHVFGGSTSWHRFSLIDKFIGHFGEWWLLGTNSTAHWGALMFDITNEYIIQGLHGGILGLLLYLAMLTVAFRRAGLLYRYTARDPIRLAYSWALGIALFAHAVVHFGVGYFGQMPFPFYITLAAVSGLSAAYAPDRAKRRAPARARAAAEAPAARPEPGSGAIATARTGRR